MEAAVETAEAPKKKAVRQGSVAALEAQHQLAEEASEWITSRYHLHDDARDGVVQVCSRVVTLGRG